MTSAPIKPADYQLIKGIIAEYLQLSDYAQPTFLKQIAAQHPQLIDTVKSMIGFQDKSTGFILDTLPIDLDRSAEIDAALFSKDDQAKFTLHNKLSQGGYAQVYRAIQKKPVNREVAIKFLNHLPNQSLLLAEAEFLASLNHPNIATLYECGETKDQRLFIVMELVAGTDLISYADQQQLSIADKIHLFQQLCLGVVHAHEKGIIHCDIKPANVLISEINGNPIVKIIDFGVSKYQRLNEDDSSISGTPAFMAPETLSRKDLLIDTRNDVYALGVLLHRLLYGFMPDFKKGKKTPLNADLKAIINCAMHQDRQQRYSNVMELLDDLRRHLSHKVVKSRPHGMWYGMSRFLLRYKFPVMVFVALMLTVAGGYYAQSVQATAAKEAQIEAEKVTAFVIDLLSTVDPQSIGEKQTAPELVLQAKQKLMSLKQPTQTDGRFMFTVAEMLFRLDRQSDALTMAQASLEVRQQYHDPHHVTLLDNLTQLAKIHRKLRQYQQAKAVLLRAVDIQQQHNADPRQLSFIHNQLGNLYFDLKDNQQSIAEHQKALEYRKQLGDEKLIADSLNNIGAQYYDLKQWQQSGEYFHQSLKLLKKAYGPDHAYTYYVINNLASIEEFQFNWPAAELLFKEAVAGLTRIYGEHHFNSLTSLTNLGKMYQRMERYDDAIDAITEVLSRHTNSNDDYNRTRMMSLLGQIYAEKGDFEMSRDHFEQGLVTAQSIQPTNHYITAMVHYYYGCAQASQKSYVNAETLLSQVLVHDAQHKRSHYYMTLRAQTQLAHLYRDQGRMQSAFDLYHQVLRAPGVDNSFKTNVTIEVHMGLARWYQITGDLAQGLDHIQQAHELNLKLYGEFNKRGGEITSLQGDLYASFGELEKAQSHHHKAVSIFRKVLPAGHSLIKKTTEKLN